MKNIRIYLLVLCSVVFTTVSFFLSGASSSAATAIKDVLVVNTQSNPVPVTAQGATTVTGTVAVSNFPGSFAVSNFPSSQNVEVTNFPNTQRVSVSNFPDTQSVLISNFPNVQEVKPSGTPITLRNFSGIYNSHQRRIPLTTDGLGGSNATVLNGRLAIGSITVTALSSQDPNTPFVDLMMTDCAGNDLERLNMVSLVEGSTVHIDYPTPQLTPWDGPSDHFCLAAIISNDDDVLTNAEVNVTVVGNLR